MKRYGLSAEASTALSTSYAVLTLDNDTTADAGARAVPDRCELGWLQLELDTLGSATQATFYLAADSGGDVPLTEEVVVDIVTGKTTATDGGAHAYLGLPYCRPSAGTLGKLYAVVKVNASTPNCKARIYWVEWL